MKYILAYLTILAFAFNGLLLSAKQVDIITAKIVAINCYYEKINTQSKVDYNNITISETFTINSKSVNYYYVFNFSKRGFVIVSADDNAYPIIGYSIDSKFNIENQTDNLKSWMGHYEKEIESIINSKTSANDDIIAQWKHYLTKPEIITNDNKSTTVLPLITSTWDQGMFYNTLCPADTAGPAGHALVGCVATAMAQVMYYYRYPITGYGTHTYYSNNYGQLTVNPGATTYDWIAMADNLTSMNNAVATISYQAGVTVDMDYTPAWSGASMNAAAEALQNHFKYNHVNVSYLSNTNNTSWVNLLKTELNASRPVLYAGYDQNYTAGHAFICDGYDVLNFFHFNWGWSGYANGYFTVNSLNPAGQYDFSYGQTALTNIYPSSGYPYLCTGLPIATITSRTGTFEDGSGPSDYQNNNDCSWLIAPNRATDIYLFFKSISTEPNNDKIIIYDGATTADSILGTFSGNTLPPTVHSTGGQMLVRFITNSSVSSSGWKASFSANLAPMCDALTILTSPSGTFSDGSGNELYDYSTLCDWEIFPPNTLTITFGFSSFDISPSDKIRIIDIAPAQAVVLDTYTGNSNPTTKTYNTGKLVIVFYSTSTTNGQGWDAFYTSTQSGIDNINMAAYNIYPNPTNSSFTIDGNEKKSTLKIFNLSGQILKTVKLNDTETLVDINDFPKGIYLMEVISDKSVSHSKIIKD